MSSYVGEHIGQKKSLLRRFGLKPWECLNEGGHWIKRGNDLAGEEQSTLSAFPKPHRFIIGKGLNKNLKY